MMQNSLEGPLVELFFPEEGAVDHDAEFTAVLVACIHLEERGGVLVSSDASESSFLTSNLGVGTVMPTVVISITHHCSAFVKNFKLEKGLPQHLRHAVMYIAGLHVAMPPPQGVEGLAVLTTADFFRYLFWKLRTSEVTKEEESDLPIPESTTRPFLDKLMLPMQGLAAFLPPAVYCTAVVLNNFQQPAWMLKLALPEDIVRQEWKTPLRLAACAASFSLKFVLDTIRSHSDERWRMIGCREKPKMNQTGPYAVVRHPAYSVMLLQQVLYSVMYWSYVPLASLGALVGVFAIKMPIEEKAAQDDDVIGNDYTEYMKKTPARIIPYVW